MARNTRKKPRAGDGITYHREDGDHSVVVDRIDEERGLIFYRWDGVERITTFTLWPVLAESEWR